MTPATRPGPLQLSVPPIDGADEGQPRLLKAPVSAVGISATAIPWEKADRSGGSDACWPWMGWRTSKGYARIKVAGREYSVARLILAVSAGLEACHHCDNPPCVNPAHLYAGTRKDNVRDMVARGRMPAQMRPKTHCARGHELAGANVRSRANGWHTCKVCDRLTHRLQRAARVTPMASATD